MCGGRSPNGNMKICNPQGVVIVVGIVDAASRIAGTFLYDVITGFTISTFFRVAKIGYYFKTTPLNLKIFEWILYFRSIAANSITISFKNFQKNGSPVCQGLAAF